MAKAKKTTTKVTKVAKKSECDHAWVSNPGGVGDERYICSKCGAKSA